MSPAERQRDPLRAVRRALLRLLTPVARRLAVGRDRPGPFIAADGRPVPGSLSAKLRIPVHGVAQGMFLRSRDVTNPVLLYVHGGPGMPEYWLTRRYPTRLEDHFTVAWWEQRGAGLSFDPHIPPESMTIEQFVADTLEVTDHLRRRFGVDRIYLLGHSWGSYVGIQAVAADPSRYHAYIGVAQITHQVESERLAHAYMLGRFRERGDRGMVRRLEAALVNPGRPLPAAYDALRDTAMHRLGVGTTRDMRSVVTGIFLPSWAFPGYTFIEKVNLWRGKVASRRTGLWDRMQATDLGAIVARLDVPAYFLHGIHDYTVSYPLARAFARRLEAPRVGFYTFEQSAHSPVFEEPDRALRILVEDVLTGANGLADPQEGDAAGRPAGRDRWDRARRPEPGETS